MSFTSLWRLTVAESDTCNRSDVILQGLGFADMGLERIEIGAFCGISEISTLNLEYNKLTSLPQLCTFKCCLMYLNIGNNKISRLNKHYFKGFKTLRSIDLSNNYLLELPDLHWIQHSVSRLTAVNNTLESLDALQTSGTYKKLNDVLVSENKIRTFNVSLLRHMPELDLLTLDGNKLTHIDYFRSFEIRQVTLSDNPWLCDEELSWMGEEDMGFERGLTCATPACLHGMVIADMSKQIIFSHPLGFRGLTGPKLYGGMMVNSLR